MTLTRYAYITGTAFSGSTLLSFLLDSLPDVVSVGEMTDVVADSSDAPKSSSVAASGSAPQDASKETEHSDRTAMLRFVMVMAMSSRGRDDPRHG